MENFSLIQIPVIIKKGSSQNYEFIDVVGIIIISKVHPYDTPLQMSYKINLCFPTFLIHNIIYLNLTPCINSQNQNYPISEPQIKSQLAIYFGKFISEKIQAKDSRVKVSEQNIIILLKSEDNGEIINKKNPEFSFDKNNNSLEYTSNQQDVTPYFYNMSSKNSISCRNLSKQVSKKVDHWIKQNSFQQIEQISAYNQINEKITQRVKNRVTNAQRQPMKYQDYLQSGKRYSRNSSSSFKKSTNKGEQIIQTSHFNYSMMNKSDANSSQLNHSQSTVVNLRINDVCIKKESQTKHARAESFQIMMRRLSQISTPNKSYNVSPRENPVYSQYLKQNEIPKAPTIPNYKVLQDLMKKQQVTKIKLEQKINAIFNCIDQNRDGIIDMHAFIRAKLGPMHKNLVEPIIIEARVLSIRLDHQEFCSLMQKKLNILSIQERKDFLYSPISK